MTQGYRRKLEIVESRISMCLTSLHQFLRSDEHTYSIWFSEQHSFHGPIVCPRLLDRVRETHPKERLSIREDSNAVGKSELTRQKIHHHDNHLRTLLAKIEAPDNDPDLLAIRIPERLLRITCLME